MSNSKLLRKMYEEYSASVGLGPDARYVDQFPLRPVVPLDIGVGGVFILGAYPSARFMTINGVSDVPAGDNLGPFANERWFDGSRIREQPSARELQEHFLEPLALVRSECWITDLVKVFLFKNGHAARYRKLAYRVAPGYERERFYELGIRSLPWIADELRIATPKLVVTLGAEVAGVLRGIKGAAAQAALLQPSVEQLAVGEHIVPTIHCAHPGILMRGGGLNRWPSLHREEFIPAIRRFLKQTTR